MKKYKLIKEYPGSDHEGIIVSLKTPNGLYEGYQYNYYTKHVENNPEYWEEVIEKDYEIISYVAKDNPTNITTKRRGAHLHEEYWTIHKVKRLSDGEIFTVGDRAKVYEYGSIKTIDSMDLITKCSSMKQGIWLNYNSGSSHIIHAIKQKQPIFLTHNGQDIFEGDTVWYVNKERLDLDHFTTHSNITFRSDINAYFLTKEAAEDYIKRNKVLFTTADGVGIKKGNMVHGVYRTTHTISNTVVGCNRGLHDTFEAIFSTRAAAENYLVQKSHSLSIEDFWEFVCWGGSNIAKSKRLKRLVKERLNLK